MEQIDLLTLVGRNGEVIGRSVACVEAAKRIREIAMRSGAVDKQALLDLANDLITPALGDVA